MIRTDAEYQDALKRLQQDRAVAETQRERLLDMDLTEPEIARALEPALAFHDQLREEVDAYERMRRGDITPIESLMDIGRVLVGLRIARGLTQRQLAELMSVSESQVSRDERNDYHGITLERAQRIVRALQGKVRVQVEVLDENDSLIPA
jgi:DNA-directed RNA polymerase specialized sigma subunit